MLTFQEFLDEQDNSTHTGYDYEKNAVELLKPLGIVPPNFIPDGAKNEGPDLILVKNRKTAGCELKKNPASAGSITMYWKNGVWTIGKADEANEEKLDVIKLSQEVGLLNLIKQRWTNEPYLYSTNPDVLKDIQGLERRAKYSAELKRFPEIRGEIAATKIEEYYNKKHCHYINIGTHGFYLLGHSNPLKIANIPTFGESAKASYRARVQAKGGGTYRFTFEMSFSGLKKSPYNLAPTVSKKSPDIKKGNDLSWFLA